ncbi:DUF6153 family protein [Lentzea alba]|uniref:DUF6153 family protein n=1 Tax=Lentzea alba TaxID=2714351 RepID=UPI0039C000A9
MSGSMQRTAAQWALLCLLFLGVVGMHHVNVDTDMPAGHAVMSATADPHSGRAPDEPGPAPTHDMLHLCMAILCAVTPLLLLASLLLRVVQPHEDGTAATPSWPRAPARPPPPGGRGLLNSLCVLRL